MFVARCVFRGSEVLDNFNCEPVASVNPSNGTIVVRLASSIQSPQGLFALVQSTDIGNSAVCGNPTLAAGAVQVEVQCTDLSSTTYKLLVFGPPY